MFPLVQFSENTEYCPRAAATKPSINTSPARDVMVKKVVAKYCVCVKERHKFRESVGLGERNSKTRKSEQKRKKRGLLTKRRGATY
jgi:hypothetical protein